MKNIYAVERYIDQIRIKSDRSLNDRLVYFDTEQEAKDFIIARARQHLLEAENAVSPLKHRLARCIKKFGTDSDLAKKE